MKIPRDLSGQELVQALCRHWDYRIIHQEGSHIVLETEEPSPSVCLFPTTKPFASGHWPPFSEPWQTIKGIERQKILESL